MRVLVVGQTPPPIHGQAIMIEKFVKGPHDRLTIRHVRMQFSENLDQIGKLQLSKIVHLFQIILQIYWAKIWFRPTVLYYPPAGPKKVALIRDAAILIATRWMFRHTVFHFQASGCSELIPHLSNFWRRVITFALSKPSLAIELSPLASPDGAFLQAKRVVRIPNSSEDKSLQFPRMANADSPSSRPVRILYLGTVCEEKGTRDLVRAAKLLRVTTHDFHIDFVGGFQPDSFRAEIEKEIESIGLSDKITLHGQRLGDDKWKMLAQADLFCFPSFYSSEGFPCVLVEAMSFGLPIVSTQWRGIPSIVEDGVTGTLVVPHAIEDLARQLQLLIDDESLRRKLGTAGQDRYRAAFTDRQYLESMQRAILELSR